jgi:signal transduction histidine kinase
MFSTLYARLALMLVALFLCAGAVIVTIAYQGAQLYQQEVAQTMNRDLAQHVIAERPLLKDRAVDHGALEQVFHSMMLINPAIEIYLLDTDGRIVSYFAPHGHVKRERVALAPIQAFLDNAALPIRGEDPRDPGRDKIFSAALIQGADGAQGYLYIVLGGEVYDGVAALLEGSYIGRLSAFTMVAALLLALLAGLVLFAYLTRRLRRLADAVQDFRRADFLHPPALPATGGGGDEIEQLATVFQGMAARIGAQLQRITHNDQQRRELIASVSHDLRTPLTALQGHLETLLIKHDQLNADERRHYLEIAVRHGERLGRLIGDLFELSRLEAGDAPFHAEPFALGELVQDVMQRFSDQAARAQVTLVVGAEPRWPFVQGDLGLIERLLANLIENALRHTPAGGTITLICAPRGQRVEVEVSDTGRGIAAADLPRIFERFYRGAGAEPQRGGLGLAIAQRIVQLHGGAIRVESEPGAGARFRFDLPRQPLAAAGA